MRKLAVALLAGLPLVVLGAAGNLTGKWEVDASFDDSASSGGGFDCAFTQEGERLTGNCSEAAVTGEVKGQNVSWRMMKGGSPSETITFAGTVDEAWTSMKGRFTMADKGGHFTAVKQ